MLYIDPRHKMRARVLAVFFTLIIFVTVLWFVHFARHYPQMTQDDVRRALAGGMSLQFITIAFLVVAVTAVMQFKL